MKRFVAIFCVLSIVFFVSPHLFSIGAQAKEICPAGFENLCKIKVEDNSSIIGNVVQGLTIVAIIVSVIFLIVGGIRWIMSGGDKGKVEQAKSTVTAAVVGLVISLAAFFIVNLVTYMFGGGVDLKSLKIPRLID